MNCPVCDEKMREVERHGVNVDICPGCKGVWLDRGELEKIIELTEGGAGSVSVREPRDEARPLPPRDERYRDERYDERRDYRGDDRDRHHRKRRGGMLGEIFEMFGD